MPATAAEVAARLGNSALDPWKPIDNIRMGAAYLRYLIDRFDGDVPTAVAAYYQGHGAVEVAGISENAATYTRMVLARQLQFRRAGQTSQP
jgi:soluble lytic murein transglycosylase-like protein